MGSKPTLRRPGGSRPPFQISSFFARIKTAPMQRTEDKTSGLLRWPLLRQLKYRTRGTGVEVMSRQTRAMRARIEDATVARSVCPYCGVGCGQLVYHKNGKVIQIEGDPHSPISQGNLCPKGAASRQLLEHESRVTKVKYRPPFARQWQELGLDQAIEMIADRIWDTRKRTFVERSSE